MYRLANDEELILRHELGRGVDEESDASVDTGYEPARHGDIEPDLEIRDAQGLDM